MSTTIDDRVVEMRFDNADFESNVSQTLSTLDKLKLALNLPGATKGLNDVSAAAAKVDMTPMGKAIDTVQAKFSSLDVVAYTALQNITNSVLNTGKKIIDKFTIEPIRTGFSEYELKMGSVQTIMASTGESIDTVNKYLEDLNKYSDQTIYSFSDMTNSIGKFTNAGVSLKDAVTAIKGVSNEAAVSGANANEASRAMYNFAQALSAGYVKLIDWKSIENANMATVEFKNELIKTAVEVGTLTKNTEGLYDVIKDDEVFEIGLDATHNFNDSLQKQWMTTEVLTKTLARYADANTDLGKKAFAAAQDVKTFSMMMDTLKEAAQSGWAATWEIVVGDFEEAKVVFTDFSNIFSDIIGHFDDARNSILRGGLSSSWKQLTDRITDSGVAMNEFEDSLAKVVNSHGEDYTQIILDHKNLSTAIKDGAIQGKWLSEAYKELTKNAGDLKDETTGLAKYTDEELEKIAALRLELDDVGSNARKLLRTLTSESGREYIFETLKNSLLGIVKLTSTFAHAWRDVIPPVLTSERLYKALETIGKFSRHLVMSDDNADKLQRTLRGLLSPLGILSNILGRIGGTAAKVIGKIFGLGDKLKFNLLDYTAKLGDVLYNFEQWIIGVEGLGKYWGKLEDELFAGLSIVKQYINAFLEIPQVKSAIDTVKASLTGFADDLPGKLQSAAVSFKNFVVGFYRNVRDFASTIKNMPRVQAAFKALKEGFSNFLGDMPELFRDGVERFRGFIETVKQMDGLTLDNIKTAVRLFGKTVSDYFTQVFAKVGGVKELFVKFVAAVAGGMDQATNAVSKGKGKLQEFISIVKNVAKAVKAFVIEHKGALIAIGASAGMVLAIYKIGKALKTIAQPLFDVGGFLSGINSSLNKVATGMNKKMKAEAVKSYAEALAILAGSLFLISKIPTADLIKAGIAIGVLAGVLVVLAFAMNKLQGSGLKENAGNALKGTVFLSIAGSLILMVQALKSLDSIEHPEKIKTNLIYLGVMLAALVIAAKILTGSRSVLRDMSSSASALQILALATALKIMVSSLDDLGQYDINTIAKSLLMIVGVAFALKLVMKTLKGIDAGAGFSAIAAVVSLMLLVHAFKMIANLNLDKAKKNIGAFIVIFGMFAVLMAASKLAGKNAAQGGVGIFLMSAALIEIAIAMKLLANLSAAELRKGTEVIIGIFAAFAIVIAASYLSGKYAARAGVMIAAMSAAMILLAGAIWILSTLDPAGLDRGVKAIEGIIKCFALLIAASGLASKATSTIVVITVAVGMLSIAIAGLSMIPEDQLKAATNALTQILLIFSIVMLASKYATGDFKAIAAMAVAIGLIGGVLYLLKDIDSAGALANATAISEILIVLAASLRIISNTKALKAKTIASLVVMVGIIGLIGVILGLLSKYDVNASLRTATAISELLIVLAASLRVMSNTKVIKLNTMTSMVIMVGIIGVLGLILGKLCEMDNIDKALGIATALSELVLAMSAACVLLGLAGKVSAGAQTGVFTLIEVIAVIGTFMGAVGGLMTLFPKAEEFLDKGIDILNKIATGIGEFVGNLVRGFLGSLLGSSPLSDIARELSMFMVSLQPFLFLSKQLDESVLKGIGTLVACVAAVTVSDFINGVRNLPILKHIFGAGSLGKFGQELLSFAKPLVAFTYLTRDIDSDDLNGVAAAAKTIAEFAKIVPNEGGLLGKLVGNNSLGTFGKELLAFAKPFLAFTYITRGIKASDTEGVSAAATAIAEFAKIVPNEGGLLSWVVGDNKLGTFGKELLSFGKPFLAFTYITRGIKASDTEGVAAAATAIAKFADIVPNEGGFLSWVVGDNKLGTFGQELLSFAKPLVAFTYLTRDIDESDVEGAVAAAKIITDFANIIPESGGLLSAIFGGNTPLSKFGDELTSFGEDFSDFNKNVKDIDQSKVITAVNMVEKVMEIGQGKIPDSGIYTALFKAIGTMGQNLQGFYSNIKDIEPENLNAFTDMIRTIASLADEASGINADSFANFSLALQNIATADMSGFATGLSESVPNVTDIFDQLMNAILGKISEYVPRITLAFSTMMNDVSLSLYTRKSAFETAASAMMDGLAHGLTAYPNRIPLILSDIMQEAVTVVSSKNEDFRVAGDDCINAFAGAFRTGQSDSVESIYAMLGNIISAISEKNATMHSVGSTLIANFTSGIDSQSGNVNHALVSILARMQASANSYRTPLRNVAVSIMKNFQSGISSGTSKVYTIFNNMMRTSLSKVRGYISSFYTAGISLATAIKRGASGVSVSSGFTSTLSSAVSSVESYYSDFYDAGEYLVKGFRNGINDYAYIARNAARDLGESTARTLQNSVQEKSPSKLTYKFGYFFDKGFANAIGDYSYLAENASDKLGNKAVDTLGDTLSYIGEMFDSGIDVEPTIRPVLDLSNVKSGAGMINSMLGMGTTVDLGYSGIVTGRLSDVTAEISQQEQLNILRRMSNLMDTYFPQFNENDVYLDTGAIAGAVNRKLGLQT